MGEGNHAKEMLQTGRINPLVVRKSSALKSRLIQSEWNGHMLWKHFQITGNVSGRPVTSHEFEFCLPP